MAFIFKKIKKELQSRPFDYALQNKVNATLCKYYRLKKNKSQQKRYKKRKKRLQ